MRTKILGISLGLVLIALISTIALASNWKFNFPVTITDTSNVTRTYYPVSLNATGQQYINGGYILSSGLDTNMQIGSTSIPYMVGTDHITTVIPQLPSGGKAVLTFYTGYSPVQTNFSIIVGDGGYVYTSYNATLNGGASWNYTSSGYLNTTQFTKVAGQPGAWQLETGNNAVTARIASTNWTNVFNAAPTYGMVVTDIAIASTNTSYIRVRFQNTGGIAHGATVGYIHVLDSVGAWHIADDAYGTGWTVPHDACDNNTGTQAGYTIPGGSFSNYLVLSYSGLSGNISSIRYLVRRFIFALLRLVLIGT